VQFLKGDFVNHRLSAVNDYEPGTSVLNVLLKSGKYTFTRKFNLTIGFVSITQREQGFWLKAGYPPCLSKRKKVSQGVYLSPKQAGYSPGNMPGFCFNRLLQNGTLTTPIAKAAPVRYPFQVISVCLVV
jgi:hypothetical protein